MNEKEGYIISVIPEQKYKSCYGCKWYKHYMMKSGRDPIYAHNCDHPDAPGNYDFRGNLIFIFGKVETPDWCPIGERKDANG
jgi:hypothetical protein